MITRIDYHYFQRRSLSDSISTLSVLGTASSSMRATRTDKRLCDCLSVVGALSLRVSLVCSRYSLIFDEGHSNWQASLRLPFSSWGVVSSSDFASAKLYLYYLSSESICDAFTRNDKEPIRNLVKRCFQFEWFCFCKIVPRTISYFDTYIAHSSVL